MTEVPATAVTGDVSVTPVELADTGWPMFNVLEWPVCMAVDSAMSLLCATPVSLKFSR